MTHKKGLPSISRQTEAWKPATIKQKTQAMIMLAKLPKRPGTDPELQIDIYMIALDGVPAFALDEGIKAIFRGVLGHAFMPSPPELRIQCDRFVNAVRDADARDLEHKRRYQWPEDLRSAEKRTPKSLARSRAVYERFCATYAPAEVEKPPPRTVPDYSQNKIVVTEALLRTLKRKNANPDEEPNGRHGQGN